MRNTIWKFEILATDEQEIIMPVGAEILSVQAQKEKPCMWALVDPNAVTETRYIEMFGTGHPVFFDMGVTRNYIGTFQLHSGDLVFHVFENIT